MDVKEAKLLLEKIKSRDIVKAMDLVWHMEIKGPFIERNRRKACEIIIKRYFCENKSTLKSLDYEGFGTAARVMQIEHRALLFLGKLIKEYYEKNN